MRATWKGTLCVGKVAIPIGLYTAADHVDDVSFRTLHEPCGSPITTARRCLTCDVDLGAGPTAETVTGFEFAEGQFVRITREEIQNAIAGDRIELDRFAPLELVDQAMRDTTYLVGPGADPAAARAYDALFQALGQRELVGMGRIGLATRERVAIVAPIAVGRARLLGLTTLFAPEGLRERDALEISERVGALGALAATDEEIELFGDVVSQRRVGVAFGWHTVKRLYPSKLRELVEAKRAGGETIVAATTLAVAPVDLTEALKKSLKRPRAKV